MPACLHGCHGLLHLDLSSNRLVLSTAQPALTAHPTSSRPPATLAGGAAAGGAAAGGAAERSANSFEAHTPVSSAELAVVSSQSAEQPGTDPLSALRQLRHLSLAENGLLDLPSALFGLPLEVLELSGNELRRLPPRVIELSSLTALHAARNALHALPPQLGHCTNLGLLDTASNAPLSWPPPEVMRMALPAILQWLRGHPNGPPKEKRSEGDAEA